MPRCDCNHVAHYEHSTGTPLGRPGHLYNCAFLEEDLVEIPSAMGGTTRVCHECALDCHACFLPSLLDGASLKALLAHINQASHCHGRNQC